MAAKGAPKAPLSRFFHCLLFVVQSARHPIGACVQLFVLHSECTEGVARVLGTYTVPKRSCHHVVAVRPYKKITSCTILRYPGTEPVLFTKLPLALLLGVLTFFVEHPLSRYCSNYYFFPTMVLFRRLFSCLSGCAR
jgi:hypothetical protein